MLTFLIISNIICWLAFLVAEVFFRKRILDFEDKVIMNFICSWLAKRGLTVKEIEK